MSRLTLRLALAATSATLLTLMAACAAEQEAPASLPPSPQATASTPVEAAIPEETPSPTPDEPAASELVEGTIVLTDGTELFILRDDATWMDSPSNATDAKLLGVPVAGLVRIPNAEVGVNIRLLSDQTLEAQQNDLSQSGASGFVTSADAWGNPQLVLERNNKLDTLRYMQLTFKEVARLGSQGVLCEVVAMEGTSQSLIKQAEQICASVH